jgi:hypothetical protein
MNHRLLVAILLAAPALSGCLSVSALFNSKKVFDKDTRTAVSSLAGLGDLFVAAPAVGVAAYYGLGSNPDKPWIRDGFLECYLYFGWELFILADALCAAALKNWIWDENLTDELGFASSREPVEWPSWLRTRGP